MSAEEARTKATGGRTARSFTAREDLVQALVSLGVTRNAATRVLKSSVSVSFILYQMNFFYLGKIVILCISEYFCDCAQLGFHEIYSHLVYVDKPVE